jgi:hypothetical protein
MKITKCHRDKETAFEGTLDELIQVFSYTLECGHSWNHKINKHPTTLKSLVSNINKSYKETQGACYNQDYVF